MKDEDHSMSADGKFQPNVVNSAVFLLSAVIQVGLCLIFLTFSCTSSTLLLSHFIQIFFLSVFCFIMILSSHASVDAYFFFSLHFYDTFSPSLQDSTERFQVFSLIYELFCYRCLHFMWCWFWFFAEKDNNLFVLHFKCLQVNNFVVNYRGHPFTQSIQENIALWRSVQFIYAALLVIAGGQLEPLNDLLQMAPFPSPTFQAYLIGILLCNFGFCFSVEKLCQKYLEWFSFKFSYSYR